MSFFVKKVNGEKFTERNILGEVLSQGQDYSYVICVDNRVDSSVPMVLSFTNEENLYKTVSGAPNAPKQHCVYLFGIGAIDSATHFPSMQVAVSVFRYMLENPDRFVRGDDRLWDIAKIY